MIFLGIVCLLAANGGVGYSIYKAVTKKHKKKHSSEYFPESSFYQTLASSHRFYYSRFFVYQNKKGEAVPGSEYDSGNNQKHKSQRNHNSDKYADYKKFGHN